MKALLLCTSGPLGLKVLYCLHVIGAYVETAGPSGADILRHSRYSKRHTSISLGTDKEISLDAQNWLLEYVKNNAFDIVIPSDISSAAFLSFAKQRYPEIPCFPCSGLDVLDTLHDKWKFAQLCYEHNLPAPKTILIESIHDLTESYFEEIGFPLIIKPLQAESSHGVVKLDTYHKLISYLQSGSRYSDPPLIAQFYIPGRDIDISILAAEDKILCSTVQSWVEDGVLEFTSNPEMVSIAAQIVSVFHYEGLAHFDMRIDSRNDKLYVIECNPRPWYTISASMWQGLNFIETGIHYTLDNLVPEIDELSGQGRYCLAGSLAKQLFVPFSGWQNLSINSFKGFLQAMTDPLPHLLQKIRNN